MDSIRTVVRSPRLVLADAVAATLEFTLARVGGAPAFRARRSRSVGEARSLELASDPRAETPRELDALLHAHVLDRDERNDVGRVHPWMLAGVLAEIDELLRRG